MTGIVDSQMHVWRQTDLPWLLGPVRELGLGDHSPLQRNYPISEYSGEMRALGVEKSIYVQSGWAPNWAADEVAWAQGIADRTGMLHAIVAHADMTGSDVRPFLDRVSRYPLMRGVQLRLGGENTAVGARWTNLMRNLVSLSDYGLSLDLEIRPEQLSLAAELASGAPAVAVILKHKTLPDAENAAAWDAWSRALKLVAAIPNTCIKLSGIGAAMGRRDPALLARIVAETVRRFGPKRCMFGSNFPFETLWSASADLIADFRTATGSLSAPARQAIFGTTATRIYRLNTQEGP